MSPRPKRELGRERSTTIAQIKAVARQQMAEYGTAGLSLRGIGRAMGITAPAIYNYFPRLDDLITALIVDAFNGWPTRSASRSCLYSPRRVGRRFPASCLAYHDRCWVWLWRSASYWVCSRLLAAAAGRGGGLV